MPRTEMDSLTRNQRRLLKKTNMKRSHKLLPVPESMWPNDGVKNRTDVWLSRDFLVQAFKETTSIRLSVNRTNVQADGRWLDGITWEELQDIKRQVGFGERFAVEVFPADSNLVNVANMRHLWILHKPIPDVGWVSRP